MSEEADKHNELAPQLLRDLVKGTCGEAEAMVVLESLVFGALLFYSKGSRDPRRHMGEFLTALHDSVVDRMGK